MAGRTTASKLAAADSGWAVWVKAGRALACGVALRSQHDKSICSASAGTHRCEDVVKPAAHRRAHVNTRGARLRRSDCQALVQVGSVLVAGRRATVTRHEKG